MLIVGALFLTGLERNRLAAAVGLLLPISALAPFSVLLRKKEQPAPPLPQIDPKPVQAVRPPRSLHLPNAPLESIPAVLPLWRLFDKINRTGRTDYTVVDEAGLLIGVITLADWPRHSARDVLGWLVAADVTTHAPLPPVMSALASSSPSAENLGFFDDRRRVCGIECRVGHKPTRCNFGHGLCPDAA